MLVKEGKKERRKEGKKERRKEGKKERETDTIQTRSYFELDMITDHIAGSSVVWGSSFDNQIEIDLSEHLHHNGTSSDDTTRAVVLDLPIIKWAVTFGD